MITNARIVGTNVASTTYHGKPKARRGSVDYVVSSSSLRSVFSDCPSKWVTPYKRLDGSEAWYEQEETDATAWGNLLDTAVLTPEMLTERYVIVPDDAPKRPTKAQLNAKKNSPESAAAIAWWKDFDKANVGKIHVSKQDAWDVSGAAVRLLNYPGVGDYIKSCDKQVEIRAEWHDPDTGLIIPLCCLIDLVPNEDSDLAIADPVFLQSLADLKSTRSAKPASWDRWCDTAGYAIQAAWNTDMLVAATGRHISSFNFFLSESHAPWQPDKVLITNDPIEKSGDVDSGRAQYRQMMADYCKCLKTGFWPGYSDTDEACEGGWRAKQPNPWKENERAFAPHYAWPTLPPIEKQPAEVEDFLH